MYTCAHTRTHTHVRRNQKLKSKQCLITGVVVVVVVAAADDDDDDYSFYNSIFTSLAG